MKTKIVSLVAASVLLTSSAVAGEGFIGVGYGSVALDGSSAQSGVSVEFGATGGETFKHTIATKFVLVPQNDELGTETDGVGDVYYALGYEVLPDTIVSAKVGLGFQSVGTVGTGSNAETAYAIGLSYGAMATYRLSESFDVKASYSQMNLSYLELEYTAAVMDVSIAYRF